MLLEMLVYTGLVELECKTEGCQWLGEHEIR